MHLQHGAIVVYIMVFKAKYIRINPLANARAKGQELNRIQNLRRKTKSMKTRQGQRQCSFGFHTGRKDEWVSTLHS